jgi:nucleotide-binding universal stress UspA family protein
MDRAALTFLGGVGTVTGSKHLIDTGTSQVLLDCGLFHGLSSLRRRNWQPPPFDWKSFDEVVLTHAHLDHSGYLPMLARHGWRGPVYVTEGTARLVEIVLLDSAHLLEEEAEQANAGGWSKHRLALPLYDTQDVQRTLQLLTPVPFNEPTELSRGVELMFGRAGHLLGAAWARLAVPTARGARTVAKTAATIVLGSRQLNTFGAFALGSVSASVAARADCTVVITRGPASYPLAGAKVVVGVDGSELSEAAVGFGFEEASVRGVPLHTVLCWHQRVVAPTGFWSPRCTAVAIKQQRGFPKRWRAGERSTQMSWYRTRQPRTIRCQA